MLDKTPQTTHPFDIATQVACVDGQWRGTTSPDYFAFVGPFGGVTSATLLRTIMEQPDCAGDPLSITVNLCAPLADGTFDLKPRLVAKTRSTQHWFVELSQGDGGVAAFATAVFAQRRPSWEHRPTKMPAAPPPGDIAEWKTTGIGRWIDQYSFRFVEGKPLRTKEPLETPVDAFSKMWLSDTTPRRIDFLSLLSMSDTFFARIFQARGTIVPIGTVSLTTMFHADAADLQAEDATTVLGIADANIFYKSFSDQIGQLWSPSGRLLATTSQAVYFKA